MIHCHFEGGKWDWNDCCSEHGINDLPCIVCFYHEQCGHHEYEWRCCTGSLRHTDTSSPSRVDHRYRSCRRQSRGNTLVSPPLCPVTRNHVSLLTSEVCHWCSSTGVSGGEECYQCWWLAEVCHSYLVLGGVSELIRLPGRRDKCH